MQNEVIILIIEADTHIDHYRTDSQFIRGWSAFASQSSSDAIQLSYLLIPYPVLLMSEHERLVQN